MSKKTGQTELDEYIFTRPEMAQLLGITTNALRMRMRKGRCDLDYRFDGKQFKFKRPPKDRMISMMGNQPKTAHDKAIHDYDKKIQRKYNRGATHKGKSKYPNEAFKLQNEMKIMNHIQGKFKSEAHRKEFEKLNEEGLKIAQDNLRKKEQKSMGEFRNKPKYGGMLRGHAGKLEHDEHHTELNRKHFDINKTRPRPYSYYEVRPPVDDGSVEVDTRNFSPDDREPEFKDKVQESIWRLKNKK